MRCRKAISILLLAFFGCFSSPSDAQINLKTGYNFSILSNPGLNDAISFFNTSQGYTTPFQRINWMHGIEGGIRFKSGLHGFELTYQGAYKGTKATGQNGDITYTDRLKFATHSLAGGYQVSDRLFGIGTDLQYQLYKTKLTPGQSGAPFKNGQNMFALKFYVMLTLKGGKGVDMAIQPYYVHPFKDYNLQPLKDYFSVEPFSPPNERWNRLGLTILFYNGEK